MLEGRPKKRRMTTDRLNQRVTLHTMINELFNVDEAIDLYYKCGYNYDDEEGDKSSRIWRLIDYHSKREGVLARVCKEEKPGFDWPFT